MAETTAEKPMFWQHVVGLGRDKVTVYEEVKRKRVLYLKWRVAGADNPQYYSLREDAADAGFATATLLDEQGAPLTGRLLDRKKRWAIEQAEARFAALKGGAVIARRAKAPLTLAELWATVSDPDTGLYPKASHHRKEVKRELEHVARILGPTTHVASIGKSELTKLWRTRIRELRAGAEVGLRGAEITVQRLLAVGQWLRDLQRIPDTACIASSKWKKDLRRDWMQFAETDRLPTPNRPRHELEEFRALHRVAVDVDPRFGLMYALGAELRGGQLKRARRSDLDLPPIDAAAKVYGSFVVPGMGNKQGTKVKLSRSQRAAVDRALHPETGYLRELEAAYKDGRVKEYFLFPRGQMPGVRLFRAGGVPTQPKKTPLHPVARLTRAGAHVGDYNIRKWFREAESKAGITHEDGRNFYGGRRRAVDEVKKRKGSREALQALGGWSDTQTPDRIYADQKMEYAQDEAAELRTAIRGEEDE